MADDASVTISATILPDEISKTISGSMTVTPDDTNDKWYYKLTACTTTSTDLIAGSFLDYTAVDDDPSGDTTAVPVTVSDPVLKVIPNPVSANSILCTASSLAS